MLSGWIASITLIDVTTDQFLKGVRIFFVEFDVTYGLVKAASFGTAVPSLAARPGSKPKAARKVSGPAQHAPSCFSAVMILVLDAFWAVIWLSGRTLR